jgi:hypothetical protein
LKTVAAEVDCSWRARLATGTRANRNMVTNR